MMVDKRFSSVLLFILIGLIALIFMVPNPLYRAIPARQEFHRLISTATGRLTNVTTDASQSNIKKEIDIFKYEEPPAAGGGSPQEERRRFDLFLHSQGAICIALIHVGGAMFRNNPLPEFDADGTYYMCVDPVVNLKRNNCTVYSFGINNEWSFDDAISKKLGCKVFAFDPSMGKGDHVHSDKVQFFNLGLSDVDFPGDPKKGGKAGWKTRTLRTMMKELGHEKTLIDYLKIDIEGDEWKSLKQMLADGTLKTSAKQLGIEFHVGDERAFRQYYGITQWLDRQGFKIIFMRRNMFWTNGYEMAYVNTNIIKLPLR